MHIAKLATGIVAAMTLFGALTADATAGRYAGYVTAQSDYGNGTVRGLVRNGPFGLEVKLPNGPWVNCRKSGLLNRDNPCSETLRRETVDFWETRTEDFGGRR